MIRVALVENETLVREGLRRVLMLDSDLSVVGEARDGIEALELVGHLRPEVVLLDMRMPRLDGLGVVERTVKNLVSSILGKLWVRDRTRPVLKAISLRLI